MMTSRQRVRAALNFKPVDRIPKDLGGMASTSISAFAYSHLVKALGLKPRLPLCYDTYQMLAMPDMDVLDVLGCDVVTVFHGVTNAFYEPEKWQDYNFNGRLPARVRNRKDFIDLSDGSIKQSSSNSIMEPTSTVFNEEHAGQNIDLSAELPKPNLKQLREKLESELPTDKQIKEMVDLCKRVNDSTDKAIFLNCPFSTNISIGAFGGIAIFPMLCITETSYVMDLHELMTEFTLKRADLMLPEVSRYVDILQMSSDDWGTQNSLLAPPWVYEKLFLPYLKRINSHISKIVPNIKKFLHSCGAIHSILEMIIESGFDVLNPIQWPAGGAGYKIWKDKCRGKIAMWGGGVDSQHTLPLGSIDDVKKEVAEVVSYLSKDSGYIFNNIHNLLANTDPEKIIAMYKTVDSIKPPK
jgi:uroporphyrinogen decarboxylase